MTSYELPKRSEVEAAARPVYDLLTARNKVVKFETVDEKQRRLAKADTDFLSASTTLSNIVLAPVSAQLGKKRLLIVSDGALQYLPFAALPLPRQTDYRPLMLEHQIVSLPSASTLAVLRSELSGRAQAPKAVVVLADPVFESDDPRLKVGNKSERGKGSQNGDSAQARGVVETVETDVTRAMGETGSEGEAFQHIPRLPFTRREADAITALVPAANRKEATDFAASRTTAISPELSRYRFVHFATHGFLNSRHPELSGIVLSLVDEQGREQDGFLRAHEIYNLKLPAELVVLSGCRTGLGKDIRGEGLVSLTRGFMYAGAARVLVSLWDVNDEGTAELMARFYKLMLGRDRLSPAAALREAQASMSREKRWRAPYYWAGFTLQGEPR
jgi:CHAT domain-containing protein